jgi:hypothetical protein
MARCCERDNKHSGSVTCAKFESYSTLNFREKL